MPEYLYPLIGIALGGGTIGYLIKGFFDWLSSRGKNNADAEVTLGDGWEKYSSKLEKRVEALEVDNEAMRKRLKDVTDSYFNQQLTISDQTKKIAEQDKKILEQQEEINTLREQLQKYQQPVIMTPVTT